MRQEYDKKGLDKLSLALTPGQTYYYKFYSVLDNGEVTYSGTQSCTVPWAPTITTASLNNGTVNAAYHQALTATGDTPVKWSLASGSLPAGLSLSEAGVISGTPTTEQTATFTVKASNGASPDATKQLSITINNKPTVHVSPSAIVTKGNAGILSITIESDSMGFNSSNFAYLLMDGNNVQPGPNTFSVHNGSIIIQMNPVYLNTLDVGNHVVTIGLQGNGYNRSSVKTTISVVNPTIGDPPKTGDGTPVDILAILVILSMFGLCIAIRAKTRKA